ncbi:hypothetical protein JCM3770_006236 [Rhodotorula araucariae]
MTSSTGEGEPRGPRCCSPPPELSSFPPRAPLFSIGRPYQAVPTSDIDDSSSRSYSGPGTRSFEGDDDENALRSTPLRRWHALVGHRKARRRFVKTVVAALAGTALLYLLYDAWTRSRHHRPLWWPGRPPPPLLSDDVFLPRPPPPPPPDSPPSPTDQSANSAVPLETDEPELVDMTKFIQPRRPVPPTWPDPWADEPPSFKGREYLGVARFGSSYDGWKDLDDPPEQVPPPARYLLKALEFTAATAGRTLDGRKAKLPPGMAFDERTGRPKRIPHETLRLGRDKGWAPPRGFAAAKLGTGTVGERELPRVQYDGKEDDAESVRAAEERYRRDWVKRAFMHAWSGMTKYAYGHDEVSPVSNRWSDNYNGWGASIVDSLDTLLIMNMSREYNRAREHVAAIDFAYLVPSGAKTFSTELPDFDELDIPEPSAERPVRKPKQWVDPRLSKEFDQRSPSTIPWFETTIRYLGGLLAAYDLSSDPLMLERAAELGDWLLPALATEHGLPLARYALGYNPDGAQAGRSVLAEVGSLTLEFTRLSQLTGNEIYYEAAQRAMDTLDKRFAPAVPVPEDPKQRAGPGWRGRLGTLLPTHLDAATPKPLQGDYGWGGLADSYYEYLIKQAQLTSFSLEQYPRMYRDAVDSAYEHLIRPVEVVPGRQDLTLVGSMHFGKWQPGLEHLTCFAGGMLGLGARLLNRPHDLETAINVTNACAWVYESSRTGVGGENTVFYKAEDPSRFMTLHKPDGSGQYRTPRGSPVGVRVSDKRQIGRPETIESVFYMWRLTGERKWQDIGWTMFVNWVRHAITEAGFATIRDVSRLPTQQDDSQESFVMGETLKYYYLLFSPRDLISLDDYVFSTEAHPFYIPKPSSPASSRPLWSGPDPASPPLFVAQIGEGTWVQKWARVQQAAALAGEVWRALPVRGVPAAAPHGRRFIRQPEDDCTCALADLSAQIVVIKQPAPENNHHAMPFSYAHKVHTYTLVPKVVYLHRAGKRFSLSFGPGGRIRYNS